MITSSGRALLVGAALLGVAGVAAAAWPIFAVAVALGLAVLSARVMFARKGEVTYSRILERDRVTRGEAALASLTVRNTSSRRMGGGRAIEPYGSSELTVPIPALDAGAGRTLRYRFPTERRCVMPIGPLRVERGDPFGLVRYLQQVGDRSVLYVHPRRHVLRRLPSTLLRSLDGPTSERAPRGSVVFHAIRDYVPGDERRHIHWRTSAHTGTLKVRQFVDTSKPDITVILDTARDRHSEESFEEAIEVVASLMVATIDAGFPTRLVCTDAAEFVPSGPHASQMLLDHLAGLQVSDVASLEGTLDALRAGGNTLLVATRDLSRQESALIAARRTAFHTVLIAIPDPTGDATVAGIPSGVRAVRAASAAVIVGEWNASIR